MRVAVAVSTALAAGLLVACGGDDRSDYCEAVDKHQRELTEIAASKDPGAIFDALEHYQELAQEAPRDLRDEWRQVIDRIEALESALDEAGVDPATYDPEETLKGLPREEREAITGAGRNLGDLQTRQAMSSIEQQALDVCQTPLTR